MAGSESKSDHGHGRFCEFTSFGKIPDFLDLLRLVHNSQHCCELWLQDRRLNRLFVLVRESQAKTLLLCYFVVQHPGPLLVLTACESFGGSPKGTGEAPVLPTRPVLQGILQGLLDRAKLYASREAPA